jgi:arylsulfatase A
LFGTNVMRWIFLLPVILTAHSIVACADDSATPNIVLINIDDLGYGDVGPFGSTANSTPNLDRMAAEGRKLTSHYAAPVCTPSRASMMTGCYPKRALPIQHVLFPASSVGLNPDEITIAEVLKSVGYATACIGKWHLGDQPAFLPTQQGFDSYFGLPYSNDMGTAADGAKSNPGKPLPKRKTPPADNIKIPVDGIRGSGQPPLPLLRDMTVIEQVNAAGQTTITQRYTEEAVQFIKANRDRKFFLYLPHSAVHFPLYPGMEFRGKSGRGLFSDWVSEVDWSVGQVLDTIRALDLERQTLVIFTSDNGGAVRHGASNAPLRGSKGQTWEGGIRVPTIVWQPGTVPKGSSTSAITSHMDWLPTFAAITNARIPIDRKLDGLDITSVIHGDASSGPRNVFYYFRGLQLQAVRQGPWKLHLKGKQLFDLERNIGESVNVAGDHPDVVAQLMQLVAAMDRDLGNRESGPGVRPPGRVDDPQPLIGSDGTVREGFRPVN